MNDHAVQSIERAAERGERIGADLALAVLTTPAVALPRLFAATSALRERRFGRQVRLCTILNARSGGCAEDCAFCAQSAHHDTAAPVHPLVTEGQIVAAYDEAARLPVTHHGVVTSGCALTPKGVDRVAAALRQRPGGPVAWCASLGCLDGPALATLREAGLSRFHHNLETAESFFPRICSTHSYASRLETARAVKAAGLELCCGGILGMGESLEQRVELALTLAAEGVDSIPLNFLVAIPGTRLADVPPMRPLDILRAVAMFRLTNPGAELKVCAGRVHLRDLQSMVFTAGATGIMIGPLLTVAGRDVAADLQMIADLELEHAR